MVSPVRISPTGDTLLELNMRFKDKRDAGKRLLEFQSYIVAIRGEEFLHAADERVYRRVQDAGSQHKGELSGSDSHTQRSRHRFFGNYNHISAAAS
jgi:hypothetical protein